MIEIEELIARIEGLTGPNREVDADIFQALGGEEWRRAYLAVQEPCGCPHEQAVEYARERYSSPVTASLDAAIALTERVLPGCRMELTTSGYKPGASLITVAGSFGANGSTIPIALILATLRALSAQERDDAR